MPAGYNSQPISGFSGHIPGAKWQVGSKYVPQVNQLPKVGELDVTGAVHSGVQQTGRDMNQRLADSVQSGIDRAADAMDDVVERTETMAHGMTNQMNQYGDMDRQQRISFNDERFGAPASQGEMVASAMGAASQSSILRPGSSQMSMGYDAQGMPVRLPTNQQHSQQYQQQYHTQGYTNNQVDPRLRTEDHGGGFVERGRQMTTAPTAAPEDMSRSRSVPRRRVEKDPFEGIESGWWSKGEVLRNKERREMADRGKTVSGGQWNVRVDSPPRERRKEWRERPGEQDDIPAAGYSGHIQGLRNLGIGKSFNTAAKEAKKEYVERRRARSGGREQFYGSNGGTQLSNHSEQLNYNQSMASGMPRAPY